MTFAAVILAGGESKRMGQDKATLKIDGVPLITQIVNKLKLAGCNKIIIQIKSKEQKEKISSLLSGIEVIWGFDEYEQGDVLEALKSALIIASSENWKFIQLVPVDTPYVSPKLFEKMYDLLNDEIDIIIPSSNYSKNTPSEGLEPLLSCLKIEPVLSKILESMENNDRRLAKIFCEMNHKIITPNQLQKWGINDKSFKNLNTPKDCE